MTFYKQIGVANIPAFMNLLRTRLTLEGWTIIDINTGISVPTGNQTGNEFLAKSNGLGPGVGDPAHFVVDVAWHNMFGSGATAVSFSAAAGIRGPVDLTQVTYSGAVATCTTPVPHPFRTGDLVFFNGTSLATMNLMNGGALNDNKATLIGSPGTSVAWTQTMLQNGPGGTGTGGKAWAVYNLAAGRASDNGRNNNLILTNAPMAVFLYTDPFFFWGVVEQSGTYFWFAAGRPGREHVQAEASGAAKLANASPIVADGVSSYVMDLDRSIAGKLYVGAKIQIYNPNNAVPETVDVSRTRVNPFAVSAVNSTTQIEAILPAGTWQPGAIIGMDAALCVAGTSRVANSALNAMPIWGAFAMNGEAASLNDVSMNIRVRTSTNEEANNDPDGKSEYRGNECPLDDTRGGRLFIPGLIGVTRGVQNNADIMVGGNPANSPANDYMIFPALDVDGFAAAMGPGAS